MEEWVKEIFNKLDEANEIVVGELTDRFHDDLDGDEYRRWQIIWVLAEAKREIIKLKREWVIEERYCLMCDQWFDEW